MSTRSSSSVRVSVHRSVGRVTIRQASEVLRGMLTSLGKVHQFLAQRHGLQLATLDSGIPGAMLLPAQGKPLA